MAKYLSNIDLNKNQLQLAVIHPLAASPATPAEGQVYFDTSVGDKTMYYYNGTDWVAMGNQGDITEIQSSTTNQLTVTSGTGPIPSLAIVTGAVVDTGTALATGDQIHAFVTTQGYLEGISVNGSTFINLADGGTATSPSLTASLSATGSPSSSTYLRGDNTWATVPVPDDNYVDSVGFNTGTGVLTIGRTGALADLTQSLDGRYLTGNQSITLSGDITGTGTTSIATTISAGAVDFAMLNAAGVVTQAEGIASNDNDTTLPTSAAVKDYVDSSIIGGLVYQGGYNASTNSPDLDSAPSASIKQGWTYTVTTDGLFFTEQVRVGDVIIAESDAPTTLADWTTVQNNIDIASASQIGIGNVAEGTGVNVSYSAGTATISVDYTASSFASTISDTATVTHNLGSNDVIVHLYDTTTTETVYADISRSSVNAVDITFAATPTNSVRVLVQKIG